MTRQGLYVSNQTRQRRYRKERDEEGENNEVVQMRLYTKLAEDADDDFKASNLAAMASRVGSKISQNAEEATTRKPVNNGGDAASGFAKLIMAIQNGKLNEFIQAITKIPNMQGEQLAVQVALKTPAVKTEFNDKVATLIERKEVKPKKVADALIQSIMKSKLFQKGARETDSAEVSEAGSEVGETNSVNGSEESEAIGDTHEAVKKALGKVSDGVNPELAGESSLIVPPSEAPTVGSTIDQLLLDFPELSHWGSVNTADFKSMIEKAIAKLPADKDYYIDISPNENKGQLLGGAKLQMKLSQDGVSLIRSMNIGGYKPLRPKDIEKIKQFRAEDINFAAIRNSLSNAAK
jgi:hypothetical protein